MEQRKCRTILLSDAPASDDYFGPHDRVASAIAGLIQGEKGGRSIALEGQWGSGKTTIVNLLKDKLANSKYTVVPFDAWAHEGDPLRRTFLETVTSHFITLGWVNRDKWSNRLEELAQRLEITRTKTIPQLTRLGKLVGLSLFLVPVGLAFITGALREDVTIKLGTPNSKFWIELLIGLILALSPLLLIVFGLRSAGKDSESPSTEERAAEIWSMFFNRTYSEARNETAKTANPTSIEFEATFVELMSEALGDDKSKCALMVLDNLDRVDPEDALLIWSTLQTFLRHPNFTKYQWFDQFWVLVPYDPRAIALPWDSEENNAGFRSALLEKSFQVRFKVAPPVLSHWHSFFIAQLSQAFPDHDSREFHPVYQLLALTHDLFPQPPTIRELKLFVNQIGSLHRQWQDEFPLGYLAYYLLLASKGSINARENPRFPVPLDENVKSILGFDAHSETGRVQDAIAALHFNTKIDVARQLLLQGPILNALGREGYGDPAKLADIAKNTAGFWEVLETIIGDNQFGDRGDLLGTAVNTIAQSQLLERSSLEGARVREAICRLASRNNIDWSRNSQGPPLTGLAHILSWKADPDFTRRILHFISSGIVKFDGDARSFNATGWASALKELATQLRAAGQAEYVDEAIIQPLSDSLEIPRWLPAPALSAVLRGLCDLRNCEPTADKRLRAISQEGHILHQIGTTRLEALLSAAREFRQAKNSNAALPEESPQNPVTTAVAWCMYIYFHYSPQLSQPEDVGKALEGYEDLKQILGLAKGFYDFATDFVLILKRYDEISLLNSMFESEPSAKPFLLLCAERLEEKTRREVISPRLNAALIEKNLVPEF